MTANDSDVSDGETLTGSQVVRVYGQNLTAPFVTLTFGDVEYTPLTRGEGYIEFILSDNGTATISVDGSPFMSFEVEGITVPEGFPCRISIGKSDVPYYAPSSDHRENPIVLGSANCVNYPYRSHDEWSYFYIAWRNLAIEEADLSLHNCTINASNTSATDFAINVSPTDPSRSCYITYQGFIIAVFNYTTD